MILSIMVLTLLPDFVFRIVGRCDGKRCPRTVPCRVAAYEEKCKTLIQHRTLAAEVKMRAAVRQTADAMFLFKTTGRITEPAANTARRKLQAAGMAVAAFKTARVEKARLISSGEAIYRRFCRCVSQYRIGASRFVEDPALMESQYFSAEEYRCDSECARLFAFVEKTSNTILNSSDLVNLKEFERSA